LELTGAAGVHLIVVVVGPSRMAGMALKGPVVRAALLRPAVSGTFQIIAQPVHPVGVDLAAG
jgi:hypothetical protein